MDDLDQLKQMTQDENKVILEKIMMRKNLSNGKKLKKLLLNFTISALRCGDIIEKKISDYDAERAFVTFLYPTQRLKALQQFVLYKKLQKSSSKKNGQEIEQTEKVENFKIRDQEIKILPADEPLSINFNNIGMKKSEKLKLNAIGCGKGFLLLLFLFIFIMLLSIFVSVKTSSCSKEKEEYEKVLSDTSLQTSVEYIDCYCKNNYIDTNIGS